MKTFATFVYGLVAGLWLAMLIVIIAAAAGCEALTQRTDEYCEANPGAPTSACWYHIPAQSWDQANLKAGDNTCRTMVYYVDPVTKLLEQCP